MTNTSYPYPDLSRSSAICTIYIYSVDCTATYVKCALGCVYYRFRSKIIC